MLTLKDRYRQVLALRRLFSNYICVMASLGIRRKSMTGIKCRLRISNNRVELVRSLILFLIDTELSKQIQTIETYSDHLLMNGEIRLYFLRRPALSLLMHNGWTVQGELVSKKDIKFHLDDNLESIYEVFEKQQYNIDVSGHEVLDIGTNVGDSAIYFAMRGASTVYAFEPLPSVAQRARLNANINNFENINIYNSAVASNPGLIRVPSVIDNGEGGSFSALKMRPVGDINIKVTTLDAAIKNMKETYLLKMDCEGCEFDLIDNSYEYLRYFENIIFECHSRLMRKSSFDLIAKLSRDYWISIKPAVAGIDVMDMSIITCVRSPRKSK